MLHFQEQLSYQEIAEKLNISYDNVRQRISQARAILKQRYHQDFIGEDINQSQVYSQSRNSNISNNTQQIEVSIPNTVILSNELEIGDIVVEDKREEVVDSQSDREFEEAIKESDVNDECLPVLDVLEFWRIEKNRLSKPVKWCNFHGRQGVYPTIMNPILFYLLYYQVFWQKWSDSGGIRSPTSFFTISINDHKCSEVGDLT